MTEAELERAHESVQHRKNKQGIKITTSEYKEGYADINFHCLIRDILTLRDVFLFLVFDVGVRKIKYVLRTGLKHF